MLFLYNILTKIRNGASAQADFIVYAIPIGGVPVKAFAVLTLMRKIGMIRGFYYNEQNLHGKAETRFLIYLKYDAAGKSVIDTSFFVSKPSRRIYISAAALWQPQTTTGFFILSTSYGIRTDSEARRYNIGGEILFGIV